MSLPEDDNFSYGTYGDDSGVVFYGPPTKGFWFDSLSVSDSFINPMFLAIWERSFKSPQSPPVPQFIMDWNCGAGWTDANGIVAISRHDAEELIAGLATLSASELATQHCVHSPEKCLRCATVIRNFLQSRLARGLSVYVQDD